MWKRAHFKACYNENNTTSILQEKFSMLGTGEEPSPPFAAPTHQVWERLEPAALSEAGASLQTGRNRPDTL